MKYPQLVSMPSEISDWLEEQLEARGIDSVVYTRYILSLLHHDSVDICPDQDLHFTHPSKEVRRSGSCRKRFRCFSEWRDYTQADAEQLKRSAAIECLMSASDQNCGIESLVDELCEKLKEINSEAIVSPKLPTSSKNVDHSNISSQDLARQYYAAFPPLNYHSKTSTPSNIVTLNPKWFTSPKKKGIRKQNRSASFDEKLHYKIDTDTMKSRNVGKHKFGYFSRGRSDLGFSRSMAKSVERSESLTDWDLFMFANNSKTGNEKFEHIVEEKNTPQKAKSKVDENKNEWNDQESMHICEDLPVDILDLLDSPSPQNYTVAMMNLANMKDAGNKNFIHCGTNITSSIWSFDAVIDDSTMFDNNYNAALDTDQSETLLGIKFKSLTVGNKSIESIWANQDVAENETNMLFESFHKSSTNPSHLSEFSNDTLSNCWGSSTGTEKFEKWSDGEFFDSEQHQCNVAKSFLKLNHNKEESSFIEVTPKFGFNSFNFFNKACNMMQFLSNTVSSKKGGIDKDEENLLTSMRSHFRPINLISGVADNNTSRRYADGTSFVISANLDKPNYKRSASGSQYLETDYGSPKKLLEYKNDKSPKSALILKFFVHQNDKACQTENTENEEYVREMEHSHEIPCKKRVVSQSEEFYFPGDEEFLSEQQQCSCLSHNLAMNMDYSNGDDSTACTIHATRPDSVLAEMWKADELKHCEKCNGNKSTWKNTWTTVESDELMWPTTKESLRNIWSGGEVCSACLGLNGRRPPLSTQQSQLREDISQDGEQLLSDLSTLQKSYMEQLPAAEISYDISELIAGTKERKRRHSPVLEATKGAIPVHRGSWSIASHVKQDRFMQVASVPVLHSVTL